MFAQGAGGAQGAFDAQAQAGAFAAQQVAGAADPAGASQQQLQLLLQQQEALLQQQGQGQHAQNPAAAAAASATPGGVSGEMHIPHSGVTQPHSLDPYTTQPNLQEAAAAGGGGGAAGGAVAHGGAGHHEANAALMSLVAAGTDLGDVKVASLGMEARGHGYGSPAPKRKRGADTCVGWQERASCGRRPCVAFPCLWPLCRAFCFKCSVSRVLTCTHRRQPPHRPTQVEEAHPHHPQTHPQTPAASLAAGLASAADQYERVRTRGRGGGGPSLTTLRPFLGCYHHLCSTAGPLPTRRAGERTDFSSLQKETHLWSSSCGCRGSPLGKRCCAFPFP